MTIQQPTCGKCQSEEIIQDLIVQTQLTIENKNNSVIFGTKSIGNDPEPSGEPYCGMCGEEYKK